MPSENRPLWVKCDTCADYRGIEWHAPESLHCEHCGQRLGRIKTPNLVHPDHAYVNVRRNALIDAHSKEPVSGLEWNTDRVELHWGNVDAE